MGGESSRAAGTANPVLGVTGVLVLGLAVGALAALAAVGFVAAIEWLNDLLLISPRSRMVAADPTLIAVAAVAVPAAGGLVVGWMLMRLDGRPHGPADVIEAVQTGRGRMPGRAGILTATGALLSLGSGASVGQYGPLVHLGATLGSGLARLLRRSREVDNIAIACGVAAAISTAFNAPIAGILFAHEVVLRHFALRAFAPVAAASLAGYVVGAVLFERPPLFFVETVTIARPWEYLALIAIGAGGALVAVAYMRALLGFGRWAGRLPYPLPVRTAAAGALLGLAALWVPDILGIGKETLRFAFIEQAYGPGELAVVLVLKLAATVLCLGMGFVGGVFSPALVMGALFGALCGAAVDGLVAPVDGTVYAVAGMVAVTSPVIGAPLTTVLIVFELTHNYLLTAAALAAAVSANLVSARLVGRSLFDVQLQGRGLDLSRGRANVVLSRMPVGELARHDQLVLSADLDCAAARDRMLAADRPEAYAVDGAGRFCGTVRLPAVVRACAAAPRAPLSGLLAPKETVLEADTPVGAAMERMRDFVGEAVPVVDRERRLVGVVYETALIGAYLDTLEHLHREENAGA